MLQKMRAVMLLLLLLVSSVSAEAHNPALAREIKEFVQRFHADPKSVMDEPKQHTQRGQMVQPLFAAKTEEQKKQLLQTKFRTREEIIGRGHGGQKRAGGTQAAIQNHEDPAHLIGDNNVEWNVLLLERDAPSHFILPKSSQPWSGAYWPLQKGALGNRYAERRIEDFWPETWTEYRNRTLVQLPIETYGEDNLHHLSPAEKYDLIVGDEQMSLTEHSWQSGFEQAERNQDGVLDVAYWMGLCHGWAPAAFMMPRPQSAVTVKDAEGRDMLLYPSDIKALGTMLWANGRFQSRFIGGRCNILNPRKDSAGRTQDPQCFDMNPGAWHVTIINQLGMRQKTFVMDATYDLEVWNHPVVQYSVTYFNPETGAYGSVRDSAVHISQFSKDKFGRYRSRSTEFVVGVWMTVGYTYESLPSHRKIDTPQHDNILIVKYQYDLELTRTGQIVGGEWYTNLHPDFLWVPDHYAPGSEWEQSLPAVEHAVSAPAPAWDEGQSVPQEWRADAHRSAVAGQPLPSIVRELFRRSMSEWERSAPPPAPVPQLPKRGLMFSEYVETADDAVRAVELTNTGLGAIDFAATPYDIVVHVNKDVEWVVALREGQLPALQTLVVAHTDATEALAGLQDKPGTLLKMDGELKFKGWHAVYLRDVGTGLTVDMIGTKPMAGEWLTDVTLRRDAELDSQHPDGFPVTMKGTTWTRIPETLAGLGCLGLQEC